MKTLVKPQYEQLKMVFAYDNENCESANCADGCGDNGPSVIEIMGLILECIGLLCT